MFTLSLFLSSPCASPSGEPFDTKVEVHNQKH